MVTLKAVIENNIDDINGIDADIDKLANKYLRPIDAVRSIAKPAIVAASEIIRDKDPKKKNNFAGVDVNPNRPTESRVNAFLRTLGFPIMDIGGNFYNSGFDPYPKGTTQIFIKSNIVSSPLQNLLILREAAPERRRLVFANQDFNSTSYALALNYVKEFMVMSRELGPLDTDPQKFEIPSRILTSLFDVNNRFDDNLNPVKTFESGVHILKPFIVDPIINETITPPEYQIAAPFLPTINDARLSENKSLKRPAIEFICRLRLADTTLDSEFLSEAQRTLSGQSETQQIATVIRDTVEALLGQNNIDDANVLNTIQGFTTTQTAMLTTLVKTIKAVVEKLDENITEFNQLFSEYKLQPVPSVEGPEFIGTGKTGAYIRTFSQGNLSLSQLNAKIVRLKLEQQLQLAKNKVTAQTIGGGNEDISSLFAMPIIASVEKDYNSEIKKLENERDSHSSRMLELSAEIEKITGEVSGLGLIDVLAIYTALWAIDIKTLIGFLDDAAFNRLYDYNTDLRTGEVELRKEGLTLDGITVLKNFENKLFNILSFADNIFVQKRNSPTRADGGDGTQG